MKKTLFLLFTILLSELVLSQCPIVPTPVKFEIAKGKCYVDGSLKIDSTELSNQNWKYLKDHFFLQTGINVLHEKNRPNIRFEQTDFSDQQHFYSLNFLGDSRLASYSSQESQFYAINSILQLFQSDDKGWYLSKCKVVDFPAFKWRGLHLDVSRHFYTVDEVKRFIDLMALYKFNTFHWHLTDDQGWRIEIKQYPKLTEIGAFRDSTMMGHYSDTPRKFDVNTYGGFYTQDQISEVVQYAADRYINVVPEIELPGHSRAALAAYPELSCTGEQQGVPGTWGVFDDIYCSKEETIDFMKNVLGEVVELFPSEYFHIGGDEAPKMRWQSCNDCQKVIKENGLHDEHELQSYFIGKMDEFLTSKGKKLIGWDEILEGGLSPNAAVMSWRGVQGGIEAARQKHEVVMTPTTYCYFDYYQSSHPSEPIAIGGFLPLEKVYRFNPIPEGVQEAEEQHILGGQANLWTEYIASMDHLEYMTYPRAVALSQSVWCANKPVYELFLADFLMYQEAYLDRYSVNYSRSIHQPKLEISRKEGGINLHFKGVEENYHFKVSTKEVDGVSMSEGQVMGAKDTLYFERAREGEKVKTIRTAVLDEKGRSPFMNEFVLHANLGADIDMVTKPHPKYNNNGGLNLVDGIKGTLPWKGNQWLGFDTSYVEFIVDLGERKEITSLEMGFLDQNGSWIYLPETAAIQVSNKPRWWLRKKFKKNIDKSNFTMNIGKSGRYIRVMIHAMDVIPLRQEGGGNSPWTFIDEIQIR